MIIGDSFYFTNNDPGDEQVINTEAYSGSNSWHYARGYGSSGQGTPFSPITALEAGPGTQLDFSIAFKAARVPQGMARHRTSMSGPRPEMTARALIST